MNEYIIVEDEKIFDMETNIYPKLIFIKKKQEAFDLEANDLKNVDECIFINGVIKSNTLKISGIESPGKKIIFINCKVRDLIIKDSFLSQLQFIGCDISGAKFENSTLPGLIISKDIKKVPQQALNQLGENNPAEIKESTIRKSEFICCTLNDLKIDKTDFNDSKLKHCHIENLKIIDDVMFRDLDIRGSKFLKPDFGKCCFNNIKFKKRWFLFDWADALLLHMILIAVSIFSLLKNRNLDIKKKAKEIMKNFKYSIKKFLYKLKIYKLKIGGFIVDFASFTDFQDIQYKYYKDADFSEDYHLLWYIQDFDFIHNFKKKHPFFSRIIFVISNYFNSFGALFASSFIVIYFFSLFYEANWSNFFDKKYVDYFLLSFKIFSNFGIYYNLETHTAQDGLTKIFIIVEIIIGYFALGILLSTILFPFARRTSLPGNPQGSNKGNGVVS